MHHFLSTRPEPTGGYKGDGDGGAPVLAAPPVPPRALPTPAVVAVAAESTLKGSRSKELDQWGTSRTFDEDVDVGSYLSALQRKEQVSSSKPPDKPKKKRT